MGISMCPGSCDAGLATGPWRRDLDVDIAAIRAFGAQAVLTLIEDSEFDKLHVPRLGEMIEAAGLEWHHLPIIDMDVPDWRFERRWIYSGLRLRRLLQRGGRLVIHCRAGLGRAGMIAARLLVELGVPAAEAISQVRSKRKGAIQTHHQLLHVEQARTINTETDAAIAPRLACLLGGALGDAFGHPLEFEKFSAIQNKYGPHGMQHPPKRLVVTDDTQMTLFTLEGLARAGHTCLNDHLALLNQVHLSYLDWLECQGVKPGEGPASRLMKHATLHVQRAPGNACLTALTASTSGKPGSLENPINDSKGCGGVMRVAPIGLLPTLTVGEAFQLGLQTAALTHGHPGGYLPAGILAATLHGIFKGQTLNLALSKGREMASAFPGHEDTLSKLDTALRASKHPHLGQLPPALGLGWVGEEALAIGVYAAACSLDFATVVRIAANHDGDSDSTASIAGQLFAAQYGLETLPNSWVFRLDVLDALCDVVDWAQPLWCPPSQ